MIIDKSKYTGYIWESDKRQPEILPSEGCLDTDVVTNPFVIEAQMVDNDGKTSIGIKFVDGRYIVKSYNLSDYEDIANAEEYIPNRMPGVEKLVFKRAWRNVQDELCEGWSVLQPAELVFVGFKKTS